MDETRAVLTDRAERMARSFMSTTLPIGQMVTIRGGFGDGITGRVCGFRQHAAGDSWHDWPVFYVVTDGGRVLGGWSADQLEPVYLDACPYCGEGVACHGSARTTDGADLERFDAVHPRDRVPDLDRTFGAEPAAPAYLSQCRGCGCVGSLHVFGLPTRCPNCGSREVGNYSDGVTL